MQIFNVGNMVALLNAKYLIIIGIQKICKFCQIHFIEIKINKMMAMQNSFYFQIFVMRITAVEVGFCIMSQHSV
jgi:hypothetical protein